MKKRWQINVVLKMFATLCVIPIVFSTFFSGFNIISSGIQTNAPVEVSLFDYVSKNNILLAISFVCTVLMIMLIVAIVVFSMINVYSKKNNRFIGVLLSVFELILSILAFVFVLVFCLNSSVYDVNSSLKYVLGPCSVLCFVFGLIFGILMIISYCMKFEFKKNTKKNVVK